MTEMWRGTIGFQNAPIDNRGRLVVPALQSPNYGENAEGVVEGWSLNEDGSAVFTNVTVGSDEYTIDSGGNAALQTLNVLSGDVSLAGEPLVGSILDRRAKGIVTLGQLTDDSALTSGTTEMGVLEIAADLEDGRMYQLNLSTAVIAGTVENDDFVVSLRGEYKNSPTTASNLLAVAGVEIFSPGSDRPHVNMSLPFRCQTGDALNVNPDFVTDVAGWVAGGAGISVEHSTQYLYNGAAGSLKLVTGSGATSGTGSFVTATGSVVPGISYLAQSYVFSPESWDGVGLHINWHAADGTYISSSFGDREIVRAGNWQLITATLTAPANASRAALWLQARNSPPEGSEFYWWHAKVAQAPDNLLNFPPGIHRYLLSLRRLQGTGQGQFSVGGGLYNAITLTVEDLGEVVPDTGQVNSGGGGTTVRKTYTREYWATWGTSYRADGTSFNADDSLYQGYYSDENGNVESWIGFDFAQIQSDLLGATVEKFEVWLYFNHWYNTAGGTAVLGTHASDFNTFGDVGPVFDSGIRTADRVKMPNWPFPGGKWVDLGRLIGEEFQAGTSTGIVLGPGEDNSTLYYGRVSDVNSGDVQPKLRIKYTV